MNVFLTGATGFVGFHLLRRLVAKHEVTCLVRQDSPHRKELYSTGAKLVTGDLENCDFNQIVKGKNVVYHLAGSVFSRNSDDLFRINRDGMRSLYQAVAANSVQKFIFLSSIAAIGPQSNRSEPIREASPENPLSNYGRSKLEAEKTIRQIYKPGPQTTYIIRCPLIYGVGMNESSRIFSLVRKVLDGTFCFVGMGDNSIKLCWVENLVSFLVQLLEDKSEGVEVFHVADERIHTMQGLIERVAVLAGVPVPRKNIPMMLALVLAFISEKVNAEFSELTVERIKEFGSSWSMSIEKAKRAGYRPSTDTEDEFDKVLKWCIESERAKQCPSLR